MFSSIVNFRFGEITGRSLQLVALATEQGSPHWSAQGRIYHGWVPEIPWPKVAGIGNVLRHEYEDVAHDVLWHVVQDDLPPLERVCREELARAQASEGSARP